MPLIIPSNDIYISIISKYVAIVIFLIFVIIMFNNITHHLTQPYIDEIFHLRQCQKYCQYNFHHWDNKITTPPGLYILGFIYSEGIKILTRSSSTGGGGGGHLTCFNDNVLRSINLIGGVVILPRILQQFHNGWSKNSKNQFFWSINIISQPLLFTYYFLFYTDVWSTILIILSLGLINYKLLQYPMLSALVGFISLWFRQTNIIWIAFIASIFIDRQIKIKTGVIDRIRQFIMKSLTNWNKLLGYIVNIILFVIFLKLNGGITLGDNDNHQIELHIVQVFYCFTFITFFTIPNWLNKSTIKKYYNFIINHIILNLVIGLIIWYIMENFTIVHPFLLADNRHYAFYIYKRLLSQSYLKPLILMAYHFSSFQILSSLIKGGQLSFIGIFSYLIAVGLTLIPSPLFEPRYYITPLIIFNLYINHPHNLLEFIWLNSINLITSYIFLHKGIIW